MKKLSEELKDRIGYYVYLLVDPRDNKIFYVGKGHGNRVFQHEIEAESEERDSAKCNKINEIKASNAEVVKYIVRWGMSEEEAFILESSLIDLLSSNLVKGILTNEVAGHGSSLFGLQTVNELNEKLTTGDLDVDNLPDKVMSINVNVHRNDMDLYEAVRGNWNIGKDRANRADYILAEYGGVVVGVFKANGDWYDVAPDSDKKDVKRKWCRFDGVAVTDPVILERYLHKRLPAKSQGAANPVRYFYK